MEIIKIDHEYLKLNMSDFIQIISDVQHEYWSAEQFLIDLDGKWDNSIALLIENKIIGFIIASKKSESLHIHKFMISSKYRGKGFGKLMLSHFENNVKNFYKKITLKVYRDNLTAINFYSRNGFITFEENDDLIMMIKVLQ